MKKNGGLASSGTRNQTQKIFHVAVPNCSQNFELGRRRPFRIGALSERNFMRRSGRHVFGFDIFRVTKQNIIFLSKMFAFARPFV